MSEWKEYKLGEVCSRLRSGKNLKSSSIFPEGEYPVWGGNGIRGYTSESNFKGRCCIIGRQGAYCGNVHFFDGEAYMTEHAIVAVGNELADTYYLSCVLSLMHLENLSAQSAQPGISVQTLAMQVLSLPPIEEQRRIAGVLSSLDDKIDLLNRENATLEALAEILFRHYFIENPNPDWNEGKLGDIAIIAAGGDKPRIVSNDRTIDTPIPIFSNGIENDGLYGYTDKAKVFDECVTVSARGTIGFVALRTEPFVPIVRLITLIPQKPMTSKFLYYWAKSTDINGTGTTQQQLTVPDFKETKLLIPDSSSLMEFTEKVNVLHDKIKSNQHQILSLSSQRDTLLPRLMSGEVIVM